MAAPLSFLALKRLSQKVQIETIRLYKCLNCQDEKSCRVRLCTLLRQPLKDGACRAFWSTAIVTILEFGRSAANLPMGFSRIRRSEQTPEMWASTNVREPDDRSKARRTSSFWWRGSAREAQPSCQM